MIQKVNVFRWQWAPPVHLLQPVNDAGLLRVPDANHVEVYVTQRPAFAGRTGRCLGIAIRRRDEQLLCDFDVNSFGSGLF